MSREFKEILVGTISIAIFISVFTLVSVRDDAAAAENAEGFYRVTAIFNRVDGLYPGDNVRLGGITIGTVESQRLDDQHRAILTFVVQEDVPLPLDTSAAIHTSGLFGSKFVELEPGGDYDFMSSGDEIMFTQDSIVISDLLELIIAEGQSKRSQ